MDWRRLHRDSCSSATDRISRNASRSSHDPARHQQLAGLEGCRR
jgi:hypothetical protein